MVESPTNDARGWLSAAKARQYSGNFAEGGPLLKTLRLVENKGSHWVAVANNGASGEGSTPLIAICRCVVADNIGETVAFPAELLE